MHKNTNLITMSKNNKIHEQVDNLFITALAIS